jgi:hypothetical protein
MIYCGICGQVDIFDRPLVEAPRCFRTHALAVSICAVDATLEAQEVKLAHLKTEADESIHLRPSPMAYWELGVFVRDL